MQQDGKCDTDQADGPDHVRVRLLVPAREHDVLAEGEGVAGREAEDDHLDEEDAGGEELGTLVHPLQVVFLAAGPGDPEAEFEVDAQAAQGEDAAENPVQERDPDRTGEGVHPRGG